MFPGGEGESARRRTGFAIPERVGKYMIRPLLSLARLSLDERTGQVGYRYGIWAEEAERMDDLEFIALVTVRYYGLYANAHRGTVWKASLTHLPLRIVEEELPPVPSKVGPR